MKVVVPAGIGDFSWIWSKLCHVKDQIDEIIVVEGWPHRTTPYVELCGVKASYGDFTYAQLVMSGQIHNYRSWSDVVTDNHPDATVLLESNQHLEKGHRLEKWFPDLPTDFHYPLQINREPSPLLAPFKSSMTVGISCASYRGSEAWKTWGREEWIECLKRILAIGWKPIILGGFWDDLSSGVAASLKIPDLVGRTSVQEGVEVLNTLDAYIGFSSGLGVIRTVLDLPSFMLWPHHQLELSTSWVPPDMLRDGRYVASQWRDIEDVWPVMERYLDLCEMEASQTKGKGL